MKATKATHDTTTVLSWYRRMYEIRAFEEHIQKLFSKGEVRGTTHLATGQEAVAIGTAEALRPGDKVLCTYRGHHHCLARGMSPERAFAEILGRATGVCGGKGGSMHLTDVTKGLYGSYAIVGAHLPIAVGMAWASKIRNEQDVTVVFFGDGTTTIGAFHEAVNMAAVWSLPVLFICENNRYSEYTPIDKVCPVPRAAADRAPAYGLDGIVVDGNDIVAVRDAVAAAADRARSGGGPAIIEAETYRHGGHSRADPAKYRPQEEVDAWLARDPLAAAERTLLAAGVDTAAARAEVDASLNAAVRAALAAPEPDLAAMYTDVFAPEGAR